VTLGHVGEDVLGLVTLVGLITIAASTYMITYSHRLYALCEPALGIFSRIAEKRREGEHAARAHEHDVLVFGLGRYGSAIAARLRQRGAHVLGIDFNPAVIQRWRELGFDAEYGDASDGEFIAGLPLGGVRWVVATVLPHAIGVTHDDPRFAIAQALRSAGFRGRIAVITHRAADADALRAAGADLVLEPFEDAADQAVDLIATGAAPVRVHGEATEERPAEA
jgi:voltage-gated potassium channel Kch